MGYGKQELVDNKRRPRQKGEYNTKIKGKQEERERKKEEKTTEKIDEIKVCDFTGVLGRVYAANV